MPAHSRTGNPRRTRRPWAAAGRLFVLSGALGATACGATSTLSSPTSAGTTAASPQNRNVAEIELGRLLSSARVPANAERVATPPSAQLDNPPLSEGSLDLLSRHSLWVVDTPLAATSAWVDAHPPQGLSFSGSGGGTGMDLEQWSAPGTAAYSGATLVIEVAAIGNRTGIRADAEVIWLPVKPVDELVPVGTPVTVVVENHAGRPNGIDPPAEELLLRRHLDSAEGDQLITDLDTLLPDDGEVRHCAADSGYRVLIEVVNAGTPDVFTDWYACDIVLVTRDGTALPSLDATLQFQDVIDHLVGPPPAG